jgi:hypothetical protein
VPTFRPTARLLVLDPARRILLFSAVDRRGRVWFTPGGGVHRVPAGLSDLVDRLVSDGAPPAPVRLAWG